ncbi:hypothetical protein [Neobacillus niacini]|uniref:hypothetical protein n=1 Tax=Neobacillus niacini TaxID=86668 RepID=UPI00204003ED|nr:hypothetical protein [Neobacillus niacini]MCM3690766.1 hypothetical protein [Neobacillus niacini]
MKTTKSNFMDDLKGEHVLANFLDKYLYEKLEIQTFFRNTPDKNNYLSNQFKGIDVSFTSNRFDYIVDEKATLYYPNGLPTFAFELSYKKDNMWHPGWFYDETKETGYYLLAWPQRQDVKLSELKMEHIQKVEVMLLCRKDLQEYLDKNYGFNKTNIQIAVDEIIKAKKYGRLHTISDSSPHYYFYTANLSETPINLVIHKKTLQKLALFHFVIYRNKPYAQNSNSNKWLIPPFKSI